MKRNNSGRKSPRAQWHDYNGAEYFVTICTKNMAHYFGKIINGEIQLTQIGEYLKFQIENIHNHYHFSEVLLFTIMPNHIHLIISVDGSKIPYNRLDPCRDVACRVQKINDSRVREMNGSRIHEMDTCHVDIRDVTVDVPIMDASMDIADDAASHVPTKCQKNEYMKYVSNKQGWLSVCIGSIKSAVTKYANENGISFAWQTRFHDRIIRNQNEMNRIAEYIKNNPIVWESDCFYN